MANKLDAGSTPFCARLLLQWKCSKSRNSAGKHADLNALVLPLEGKPSAQDYKGVNPLSVMAVVGVTNKISCSLSVQQTPATQKAETKSN